MPEGASNWVSDPYWDAQGRPYVIFKMDGPGYKAGDRRYISPAEVHPSNSYGQDPRLLAWAQRMQAAKPGQSFLRERGTWDPNEGEWDRGINWTNILSAITGAGIGAGALSAAGAFGGAGGAGAGSGAAGTGIASPVVADIAGAGIPGLYGAPLASSSIPASAAMSGPAAIASQGASAGLPTTAALGGIAPATAAAGGSGSTLQKVIDALTSAAPLALPLAAGAFGSNGGGNNGSGDLNRIAQITEARMRRADPLHQAAVQLAFAGLPTYGRQGIDLPQVPLP